MRKIKEVLRLQSLGLTQSQIARSCSISQSTVHEYVSAAQAAGISWPLPDNWDEQQLEQALFPQRSARSVWRKHPEPDWSKVHEELQTHKDLTLQLVKGISDGCKEANCSLVGGETAILPDFYAPGDFDMAGFCTGIVERDHVIDGREIQTGVAIVGMAASGLHSNGYSLVRKIVF
jgi:predicted transcriptional regulator